MPERIQKLLAARGLGSRRQIERFIKDGRLTIDGKPATLGQQITGLERIMLDGKIINLAAAPPKHHRFIAYHKPVGVVSSRSDPDGRPTVFEQLPKLRGQRWISVGRLDVNSCGLILFTTDGELANALMHPSSQIQREYAVRVFGEPQEEAIKQLVKGVQLDDGPARFEDVVYSGGEGANRWFHVVLVEGRKREIRRLWEAVGMKVNRLLRVRYGPVVLERRDLQPGAFRDLTREEIDKLYDLVGQKAPAEVAGARKPKPRTKR